MNNTTLQFTSILQRIVCFVIIISTNVHSVYLEENKRTWLLSYDNVTYSLHKMYTQFHGGE